MKILLVSLFLPHPQVTHAGGKHVYEILRHLAGSHEVYLVTRFEESERQALEVIRPLCREIYPFPYRGGGNRRGFDIDKLRRFVEYLRFSRFADRISRKGCFDLVQVEWTGAALLMGKRGVPLVLDAIDVMAKPAERSAQQAKGLGRLVGWLNRKLVKVIEEMVMARCDMVLTLSDYDRSYLEQARPGLRVRAVPAVAGLEVTEREFPRQSATILFFASYRYRRLNVDAALYFCREVLPLVRQKVPAARFVIAGYGPPPELTELAECDPQVEVPGFVADAEKLYREATVFVAPILVGGGIIVKILDAMAAGTPVVTTTFGNEGVNAVVGKDLLVADDPAAFAAAVVRVLGDRKLAEQLGAHGRAFVRANYSRESLCARLDEAYEAMKREAERS